MRGEPARSNGRLAGVSATSKTKPPPASGADLERDRVLENLRASEQRLAAIIENSPGVAVQVYDRAGRVLEWNRASEAMFGFSREAALGRTLDQLIHTQEAADAFVATLASIAASGAPVGPAEHHFKRLDGSNGVCLSTIFAIPGSPRDLNFVCMDVDVTALHESNAALRETRSRFEAIFHQTFQFIGLLDTAGTLLEANRSSLEFAGVKNEDVIGRPFWEAVWWSHSPEQQALLRDAITRSAAGEFVRFEAMHSRPDGTPAYVDFSLKPVRGDDGKVVLLIPEGRDISDLKHAEAEVQRRVARFRSIAEAMFDAHYEWDVATQRIWRSDSFLRLAGTVDEHDGGYSWWRDRVHPDDYEAASASIARAVSAHVPRYDMRYRFRAADGTYRWLADRGCLEFAADGSVARTVGAIRDVTHEVEAEAAREAMEERIRASQKLESLGLLAGGIAHDFNNFLTGVLGYAALAEMELPEQSPARKSVTQIQSVALQAAELTRQMLAYSGRGAFVVKPMGLDALVVEMRPLLAKVVSRKAQLSFILAPAPVRADGAQMRQIVMNLITNASDALGSSTGQISVRTGTRIMTAEDLASPFSDATLPAGDYAYFEVRDTGEGMTAETLARIFDPFFTTKVKGRGLGLAAVLGIVRGHGGVVHVDSELGQGTTFRLVLPVETATHALPTASLQGAPSRGAGVVLIVEDEEMIRSTTRTALELAGFEVHGAFDGQDGIDAYHRLGGAVDVVLLDLTMPRKGGWEVLTELRALRPDLPVLLMSGFDRPDGRAGIAPGTVYEFIQKPFHMRELVERLSSMMPAAPHKQTNS
jgi:two-component system cell cycle sensor histidine kinase/response regulator CckA